MKIGLGILVSDGGVIPPTAASGYPQNQVVAAYNSQTFTASGGTAPYTWSIPKANSGGSIVAGTGVYTAGGTGNTIDVVRATDANGLTTDIAVFVWDPGNLGSALVAWFEGDTLTAGAIALWGDSGPSGNDLAQATALLQPTAALDAAYNNQMVVSFDATVFLKRLANPTTAQPIVEYMVGEIDADGAMWTSGLSTAKNPSVASALVGTVTRANAGTNLDEPVTPAAPTIFKAVFNGNGTSSFIGAGDWNTGGTAGAAGTNALAGLALGAYTDGLGGAAGKCAEWVILNRALTTTEETLMRQYLTVKYALSVT